MGRPPKAQPAPDADTIKAVVLRSFWPTEDQIGHWPSEHPEGAILAGRIIDVTKDELIAGMMDGSMSRYEG